MKLTGVGDTVEVLTGGQIRSENRGVLVPIGVLQGVVGARGAVHFALSSSSNSNGRSFWLLSLLSLLMKLELWRDRGDAIG